MAGLGESVKIENIVTNIFSDNVGWGSQLISPDVKVIKATRNK